MVEHAEELMKVGSEHNEVKWALEPIFDQGPLELVDVWEYKLFIVLVKLDERPSDERDVMPLIFLRNGDLGRCLTLNVSLGSCFDLLGKLMDLHFLALADLIPKPRDKQHHDSLRQRNSNVELRLGVLSVCLALFHQLLDVNSNEIFLL